MFFNEVKSYDEFARIVKDAYLKTNCEDLLDIIEIIMSIKCKCFDMWEISKILDNLADDWQVNLLLASLKVVGRDTLADFVEEVYKCYVEESKRIEEMSESFSYYQE